MKLNIKLLTDNELNFRVKEELRLGTMRAYFDNGMQLCSSWFPTVMLNSYINHEDRRGIQEIQATINKIMFDRFKSFDKVYYLCDGYGYEHETNRFINGTKFNYWIRFIPVRGDYNYYIKVYLKEKENQIREGI